MKHRHLKLMIGILVVTVTLSAAGVIAYGSFLGRASVEKDQYDFSNMSIRRVWLNTEDPVFMIDDYERLWLNDHVNVVPTGSSDTTGSQGTLMAPMEEIFQQLGGVYEESGNKITLTLNTDTLVFTIGSKDVVYNGTLQANVLSEEQIPVLVDAKGNGYNTFLADSYNVTYLPASYIFHMFQADTYKDANGAGFYAAVPIMKDEHVPVLEWKAPGYGTRYDNILNQTAEINERVADNLLSIQNEDGGFSLLPDNTDMEQEHLSARRGTLEGPSSLEGGSTVAQLRYLASFITQNQPSDTTYEKAFFKGIQYLLDSQHPSGGWQMCPSDPEGFQGNLVFTDDITTGVLALFADISILKQDDFLFAGSPVHSHILSDMRSAIQKGNSFIVNTQLSYDSKPVGWASQYNAQSEVTMGRTYERESVSAVSTAGIVEYLMTLPNPSKEIIDAIETASAWLEEVKIQDKEAVVIKDLSMQNGYDIFLLNGQEEGLENSGVEFEGNGTWATNYVYTNGKFEPLYSDVDPRRPDQKEVNNWNAKNSDHILWYATRTSIPYYDNHLAVELLEELPIWRERITQKDISSSDSGGSSSSKSTTSRVTPNADGSWIKDANGKWWFSYKKGHYPINQWEKINNLWYFFDSEGYMMTGWVFHQEKWYWLNETGEMAVGWKLVQDKWYYLESSGACLINTKTPDGYLVDETGAWIL